MATTSLSGCAFGVDKGNSTSGTTGNSGGPVDGTSSGSNTSSGGTSGGSGTSGGGGPVISEDGLRVFRTTTEYDGDLKKAAGTQGSGLDAADALCNGAAEGAGVTGKFIAMLSTKAVSASSRITDKGPYYNVPRTKQVFPTRLGIFQAKSPSTLPDLSGALGPMGAGAVSFDYEHGVWTGSTELGLSHPDTCRDWTSDGDGGHLIGGNGGDTAICYRKNALLCVEVR
jgi:hypothetical protein